MEPHPHTVGQQVANVALLSGAYLLHAVSFFLQSLATTKAAEAMLAAAGQPAALKTLPYSLLFAVAAFLPPLFAAAVRRLGGYRWPLTAAAVVGVTGGGLAAVAVYTNSYAALCVASAVMGVPNTAGNFFRFAATTLVPAHRMSRAVSAVLASGVIASVVVAPIADSVYQLLPAYEWLPVYLVIAGIYVVMTAVMLAVRYPPAPAAAAAAAAAAVAKPPPADGPGVGSGASSVNDPDVDEGAPLLAAPAPVPAPPPTVAQILASPRTMACTVGAATPYLIMMVLMAIVPLQTADDVAANVMSVHGVCMFAPFFVIGFLTERLTEAVVLLAGEAVLLASAVVMLAGAGATWSYYVGMAAVGLGWSMAFLSATTALTKLYPPEHRPKVQALNDVVVFGGVTLATALSSTVYDSVGWDGVLYMCIGIGAFGTIAALANLAMRRRA